MKNLIFLVILYFIHSDSLYCQNELPSWGIPYLDNYSPEDYQNSGKIWDIKSTENNILLLASDKGVLEFDGINWKKYKGSKGSTRSLYIKSDSIFYSGSDLDFGKWTLTKYNSYEYESLYPYKENNVEITEEFWGVHEVNGLIAFISFDNIYVYNNNQFTKIAAPSRISKSFHVKEDIYIVDENMGVYLFDGLSLSKVFSYPEDVLLEITGMTSVDDGVFISTKNNGAYILRNNQLSQWAPRLSEVLIKDKVFCHTVIRDKYYAFGTILNGIYITDQNGQIVQHLNKQKGIINNTILDLSFSENGMLWASLDLGVVGIHLMDNITYVFDHNGNFGTGQTAIIDENQFILGTNQGLYTSSWNNITTKEDISPFKLIPTSEGQVWDVCKVNGQLIIGHDKGLIQLLDKKLINISNNIGVLDILPYDNQNFLAGTYNGVYLYKYNDYEWKEFHKLDFIRGACDKLILDDAKNLWVLLPNYGIIKAKINDNLNIDSRNIFLQDLFSGDILSMVKEGGNITILTTQFKYKYNNQTDQFEQELNYHNVSKVKHRLPTNYAPQQLKDDFLFYPIYNGFAIKKANTISTNTKPYDLLVRSVSIYNNIESKVYSLDDEIPYTFNNLKVEVNIPHQKEVLYRYKLSGYNEAWSDWTTLNVFDFVNLNEGKHILEIEALLNNEERTLKKFSFSIQAPWYRSIYAYLGYCLVLFSVIFSIIKWQKYRLDQQKSQLLIKEQDSLKSQAEMFKQQAFFKQVEELKGINDGLEKDLKKAKVELIKKAKVNEEKTTIIETIKDKLLGLQKSDAISLSKIKDIIKYIERSKNEDNDAFMIQMDDLHQEYTHKLKTLFPSLTMYDLRLCTYIKTGLSTREIADIMNVLPSSINVSRSRLRKKLNLSSKDDLFSVLDQLSD